MSETTTPTPRTDAEVFDKCIEIAMRIFEASNQREWDRDAAIIRYRNCGTSNYIVRSIADVLIKIERELAEARQQRDEWEKENSLNLDNLEKAVAAGETLKKCLLQMQEAAKQMGEQRDRLAEAIKRHQMALEDDNHISEHDFRLWNVLRSLAAMEGGAK